MTSQQFMKHVELALEEAAKLRQVRGQDYGRKEFTVPDYMPFGDLSYLQMVHVKVTRLRSLVESGETDRAKLKDSILDAINYLAFWGADILIDEAHKAGFVFPPAEGFAPKKDTAKRTGLKVCQSCHTNPCDCGPHV